VSSHTAGDLEQSVR